MAKFEYATLDDSKVDQAKLALEGQAARKGEAIVGFDVFRSASHPKLQQHEATRGVEYTVIIGFTSQRELDASVKSHGDSQD